jgi:hypothetical protein
VVQPAPPAIIATPVALAGTLPVIVTLFPVMPFTGLILVV